MSTQYILSMQTTAAESPPQHARFTDKCQQVGIGWLEFFCCVFFGGGGWGGLGGVVLFCFFLHIHQ